MTDYERAQRIAELQWLAQSPNSLEAGAAQRILAAVYPDAVKAVRQ